MKNVEELLAAITEEQPCGVDVSNEMALQQIEMALESFARNRSMGLELKEESKPKWHDYVATCEELFGQGKHLQVAILLCLGWLNLEGLDGFKRGMQVIRGLVVDYWDSFYPSAEDEDERMMVLENLVTSIGQEGDYCEFMATLRRAPLSNSRLGVATLEEALGEKTPSDRDLEEEFDPSTVPGDVAMAMQDSGTEYVDGVDAMLVEIQELVEEVSTAVRDRVGASAPSWDSMNQNLAALRVFLEPYKTPEEEPVEEEAGAGAEGGEGGEAKPKGISGGVHSKEDVTRALDEIIKFYERSSNSELAKSPVPLMAKGIRRTMDMGFREMVEIFTPTTYEVLDLIAGTHQEGE